MVNNFFNRRGLSFSEIPPLEDTIKQEIVYLPEQKAELFNNFFIQQSHIEGADDNLPFIIDNGLNAPTIIFTSETVSKVIKDLDQSKAVGPDLIHNKLIVKAVDFIARPLATLFNRSITEGKFPSVWKTAHVTPIYKKGNRNLCTNYRPIS